MRKKKKKFNPFERFFKKPEPEPVKTMPAILTERPEGMSPELWKIARTNQNKYIENYLKYGKKENLKPAPTKEK
jgi:hypothetical protein